MTMQRLIEIIGPAPSELPPDEHISLLTRERDRVRASLQAFRTGFNPYPRGKPGSAKPKAQSKKPKLHPAILAAQKAGLTPEQIELVLSKLKEEANGSS